MIDSTFCPEVSNSIDSVHIFIGRQKFHMCKLNHKDSEEIRNIIVSKLSAAFQQTEEEKANDLDHVSLTNQICASSSCKLQCTTTYQVGARDTDVRKR